jgi:hypothetical protein
LDGNVFTSHFSCATMPVIGDHVINNFIIVPAMFDLGMLLEAQIHLTNEFVTVIKDVTIPSALILKTWDESRATQLIIKLDSQQAGVQSFDLFSYRHVDQTDSNSWQLNMGGKIIMEPRSMPTLTPCPPTCKLNSSRTRRTRRCRARAAMTSCFRVSTTCARSSN